MKKIEELSPVAKYIGNGVVKEFAFNCMNWQASDIFVYQGDELLVSGYTIKSDDLTDGATVVFNKAPANGTKITIRRQVELKRISQFEESGVFKAEVVNNEFNHMIAAIQQVNEIADRCVKVTVTNDQKPEELLQDVYNRLDSSNKIAAAAQKSADDAAEVVKEAQKTLVDVTAYVDNATARIDEKIKTSEESIDNTILSAIDDVKTAAMTEANKAIANAAEDATTLAKQNINEWVDSEIRPDLNAYVTVAGNEATAAADSAAAAAETLTEVERTAAAFQTNAANKLSEFNQNAAEKQEAVNVSAMAAEASENAASDYASAAEESAEKAANSELKALNAEERTKIIAEGSEAEIATLNNTLTRSAMDWALLAARNSAGIVPDNCKKMRFKRTGNTVSLAWKDPDDTTVEGQVICTWHATYIVRKLRGYPENPEDGEIILVNTQKNKYENTPLQLEEPAADDEYFYSAFPASSEGAKNLSPRNRFGLWLYGWVIDENDPIEATCIQYPDNTDNRFYNHCYMDFANDKFEFGDWKIDELLPKPCMLRYDGTVDYYIDENDFTKKEDGTASDISNINYEGNAMMRFPRVFRKKWRERNKIYCLFSNIKLDEEFECWPCKNSDGSYTDCFFGPMFEGTKDSAGRMRSIVTNGKAWASSTAQQEMDAARLNGAGWDITNWGAEDYWRDLFVLLFKRLNSQEACGFGATASTSGLTTNTGCSVSKPGLFWGSSAASANGMKMFGMENFTSHRWRRFLGCLLINGIFHIKMTKSTADGSTAADYNLTGDGYINTGIKAPSANQSYIKKLNAGKYGGLPIEVGASSTTYYSDGMWTDLSGTRMPLSGGVVSDGVVGGVFAFLCNNAPSHAVWHCGGSLIFKEPL